MCTTNQIALEPADPNILKGSITTTNNDTLIIASNLNFDTIVTLGNRFDELEEKINQKPNTYIVNNLESIEDLIDKEACKMGDLFYTLDTKNMYVIRIENKKLIASKVELSVPKRIVNCINCGAVLDEKGICPYCGSKHQ